MINKATVKMFSNFIYNIVSNGIVLLVIQILIFPALSRNFEIEKFGIIVSMFGISNVINSSFAGSLLNYKIIYYNRLREKTIFNLLFKLVLAITLFLIVLAIIYYGRYNSIMENFFLILFTTLGSYRIYLSSKYQINLIYSKIVVLDVFLVIGYILGIIFLRFIPYWSFVFFMGELFAMLYLLYDRNISSFSYNKKNDEINTALKNFSNITISKTMSTSMNYLDRFLLPPLLGAEVLSIYYISRLIPKILSLIVTPITNVLLSYFNNSNKNTNYISNKNILSSNLILLVLLIPISVSIYYFSPFLINLLYPDYNFINRIYIILAIFITVFQLLDGITNTFVLTKNNMDKQVVIQIVFITIYLPLSLILSINFSLIGYMIATIISFFIKWVITAIIALY